MALERTTTEYDYVYLVASGLLFNKKRELLFLRRSGVSSYPDHLQIPEGKIEAKEKPSLALARELAEETGLKALSMQIAYEQETNVRHEKLGQIYAKRFIYIIEADLDVEIKLSKEHSAFYWLTPEKALKEKKLIPGLREILENLQA